MAYIQPDECIDCAICESVCPVTAIFEATEAESIGLGEYVQINVEFFGDNVSGIGSPGGASLVDTPGVDHPVVTAYETQ